jgi:general stress protein 26
MAPAQGQPQQSRPANPTASLQASDDSDLIEKEWVNKAKQIVERTRDDPHKQTEELTLVKVDYMKKRYNKTIKLNK